MKLLLVEDEEDLNKLLAKGLRKKGYAVDCAFDGEEALELYSINEYDLVLLDLNIPEIDGIDVLKTIRQTDLQIKIIILSARSKIEERVYGLDIGANDYLIKPFDFMELEARIRTLLRMNFIQQENILSCGHLRVDRLSKKIYGINNTKVDLTKKEFAILEYLIVNKGQVISSEKIIEHVWDSDVDLFSNSLKYHMHSLKKKIKPICEGRDYIKNIRAQGYVIMEDENETDT